MPPEKVKVACLVLNWRDDKRTAKCIGNLLEEPLVERVYLVDNESSTGKNWKNSYQNLDWNKIEVSLVSENRGFAGGINIGIEKFLISEFSHLLVINNDAIIQPGNLIKLVNESLRLEVPHIVSPKILYPNGEVQACGSKILWHRGTVNHNCWPEPSDYVSWACILIDKSTLRAVGNLDESYFMYWEDVDFGQRLRNIGGQICVVPEAIVFHEESATKSQIGQKIIRLATASLGTFASKYPAIKAGATKRVALRIIRQTFKYGLREGLFTLSAYKWGQKNKDIAWQKIHEEKWMNQ